MNNWLTRIINRPPAKPQGRPLLLTVGGSERRRYYEMTNPLRGLTVERCRGLLEGYLRGEFVELMWAMGAPMVGIECSDPDLLALIERCNARLLEMDWDILTVDDSRAAKRQAQHLRDAYDNFDNLYEAIEHLALARFRGFAHVEVDTADNQLRIVNQWHMSRDGASGDWKFNPDASMGGFRSIPEEYRIDPQRHWWLMREVKRPVGSWGLLKHFYTHLGTADWAEFCDIYGIPTGFVVGPPNVPDGKEEQYVRWAQDAIRRMGGYLPHGSEFKQHQAPAGGSPYGGFLDYLSQKLVLAGTGGQLTMLTASGSGTLAGGAHSETFDQIASMEARKISEIFQRGFDRRLLTASGFIRAGERPLAYFKLAANQETDVGDIIEHAVKLSAAGYRLDMDQLAEKTGYILTESTPPTEVPDATALQNRCKALQNRRRPENGSTPLQGGSPSSAAKISAILERLAGDDAGAVEAGLAVFEELDPEELAGELGQQLEKALMEAVISGAASANAATPPNPRTASEAT